MENQILILREFKYLRNEYSIMALSISKSLKEMEPRVGKFNIVIMARPFHLFRYVWTY